MVAEWCGNGSGAASCALIALPPDVLDYIVQFLPLIDARRLLFVNRALAETVRYCWPVWERLVEARCAFAAQSARLESQRRRQQGEVVVIDWLTLYANHRRIRIGQVTPYPAHGGGGGSHTTSEATGILPALSRLASAVRGAFVRSAASMWRLLVTIPGTSVFVSGLDAAGKTTILYKLRLGEIVTTIPTIGFNVETVPYNFKDFVLWDVGGQANIRPMWEFHMMNSNARIYVVDACDRARLRESVHWCRHRCDDTPHLRGVPLLIFANKQDLPNAMHVEEIAAAFNEPKPLRGAWCVQGCSAETSEGLYEGLDWLSWAIDAKLSE